MHCFFRNLLFSSILLGGSNLFAQNEMDALRYSQTSPGGTARGLGLAGATGAVGGDFSSISINPASLGVYRSSEFMFTPNLKLASVKANYLNNDEQSSQGKLTISNFGIVFANPSQGTDYEKKNWKSVSFAIGYNRIADFNQQGLFSGTNTESSITQGFAEDARINGYNYQTMPPYGSFAWNGYLLDNGLRSIPQIILLNGGSLRQEKYWETKGGINEWNLAMGGNYKEKLFVGLSGSLLSYKYDRYTSYYEKDLTGSQNNYFDHLDFRETLLTNGTGLNFKLGALYNINDKAKIGAAIHTPTWIFFEDLANYEMYTNTEGLKKDLGASNTDPESYVAINNPLYFEYRMTTPFKASVNAMAFLGKYGFIAADYEYVGYNNIKYNMGSNYRTFTKEINSSIQNTFKAGHNIRLGIEGRYENLMARIGTAYSSSPFQRNDLFFGDRFDISFGLGARFGKMYLDFAFINSNYTQGEYGYPYVASNIPVGIAKIKNINNAAVLTLGLKF